MNANRFFCTSIAKKYGIKEAVIIDKLIMEMEINKQSNKTEFFIKNRWYTRNTLKELCEYVAKTTLPNLAHRLDVLEQKKIIYRIKGASEKNGSGWWYSVNLKKYSDIIINGMKGEL